MMLFLLFRDGSKTKMGRWMYKNQVEAKFLARTSIKCYFCTLLITTVKYLLLMVLNEGSLGLYGFCHIAHAYMNLRVLFRIHTWDMTLGFSSNLRNYQVMVCQTYNSNLRVKMSVLIKFCHILQCTRGKEELPVVE